MEPGKETMSGLERLKPWLLLATAGLLAVSAGISLPPLFGGAAGKPEPVREIAAATGLPQQPPAWPEPPDLGSMVIRLVIGTVVVLGLCAGVLWFGARHLRGQTAGTSGGANTLQVVATLPLGNHAVVYLVQADDQRVVVGVDRTGVQGVVVLPEPMDDGLPRPRESDTPAAAGRPLKPASIREFFA